MNRIVYVILVLILISGCVDDELCIGTGTNIVKLKIFDFSDPTTPLSVTFIGIEVIGDPESFPSYADSTLSAIDLTLDPNNENTTFILLTASRVDTLDLQYLIRPKLISPACGPEFTFNQLEVIEYTFDSLYLQEPSIEREVETNIRIYY